MVNQPVPTLEERWQDFVAEVLEKTTQKFSPEQVDSMKMVFNAGAVSGARILTEALVADGIILSSLSELTKATLDIAIWGVSPAERLRLLAKAQARAAREAAARRGGN